MSNEIIDKLVITDDDQNKMVVENRVIESEDLLVINVGSQSIYLSEDADIIAIIRYAAKHLTVSEPVHTCNKTSQYSYPATFQQENGVFAVTFRDVPSAITQGDTFIEAVDMAQDALLVMLIGKTDMPRPSIPINGDVVITITL